MLSSAATAALRDIAHHIELAIQFTEGFDYEAFVADPRTVYAATRCLEIIDLPPLRVVIAKELAAVDPSSEGKK